MRALIIGTIWPEPRSSAAGLRTWNLCETLLSAGWQVSFQANTQESEHSAALARHGIAVHTLAPNDPAFDARVAELDPDVVIFDRFMTEEQFGWRVARHSPRSLRVLDTVDLHFLRRAREEAHRTGKPLELHTDDAFREIAAIHRSDLAWLVSDFEGELLVGSFGVPEERLELLPLFYPEPGPSPAFAERAGFAFIGGFRHAPNVDAVRWLSEELWPRIRARLPSADLHVYGSYPPREISSLNDPARGFRVRGPAPDQFEALARHRVNLAPLRFGAGIKGKISDGWLVGTPVASTSIGAEGMRDSGSWGGLVADSVEELAQAAVTLHEDAGVWNACSESGRRILRSRFSREKLSRELLRGLDAAIAGLEESRRRNIMGAILQHQLYRSTEYFSRWIETKARLLQQQATE